MAKHHISFELAQHVFSDPNQLAVIERIDDGIDYGDAPALSDEQWGTALQGRFYKPMKVSKTVRIDADILEWLQRPGKGYQKRLNAVLRAAMLKGQELEE
ncbi:cytoplasmic protein [Serratia proteamaculans]|nr:cytoplasmic protein [Serratia proteamaculans]RYM48606.1 cytoplasmic protein [Serratia proteamaculans]